MTHKLRNAIGLFTVVISLTAVTGCPEFLSFLGVTPTDGDTESGGGTTNGASDRANTGGTTSGGGTAGYLVADHDAADEFDSIPSASITAAKSSLRIYYAHTSHGSQIVTGMEMLASATSTYAFTTGAGAFLEDEDGLDLGGDGDLTWASTTRARLDEAGANINVVVWSWCGGVSENTVAGINAYLNEMDRLEQEYPDVVFVYMTGHLDGSGNSGNLRARNNQIREYCRTNGKVLFDFADIESYDPDGNFYPNGSDWCEWCETWCATRDCPDSACEDCAHSVCFNCYRKGRAFWQLLARLSGWKG